MDNGRMTITDPTQLGTILGVWGHPDDEAYLCGAIMAVAADAGQRVVCVTATRGELGTSDPEAWPPEKLAAERTRELEACLATLGVTEHHWLDYPDGGCADVDQEAAIFRVEAIMSDVQPDTVLTFDPNGGTGHPDHMCACQWATAAFARVGKPGARLLYATKTPEWNEKFFTVVDPADIMMVEGLELEEVAAAELALYFKAEGPLLERKFAALACQVTQVGPFIEAAGEETYAALVAEEFFRTP
jgi:LmbE family N-acetylglucosaminyl deacetylase